MTTKKFTPTITRGPRLVPGEIDLTPPQNIGMELPTSVVQKVLPFVMGGTLLAMIGIIIGGGRQLSPYMLLVPLTMVVMVVAAMAVGAGGGKKVIEINAYRREYLRYLAGLRGRVTASADSQVAFFGYHAPHPDDLLSIVGTQRQWSRPVNADFYAATRIGIGDQPAALRLVKPALGGEASVGVGPLVGETQPYPEPVSHMWLVKFVHAYGVVHDCPKLVQLLTFPTIAIGGDGVRSAGLLTAMICHLAVFHPPDALQIRVLTDDPDHPDWSWLKWLPHVAHPTLTDDAGPVRMIGTRPDMFADLAERGPHMPDTPPQGPYVVVVDLTGGRAGFPPDGHAGVTVITLGNHRGSVYRIRVNADGGADDRVPGRPYHPVASTADFMRPADAGHVARKLAGWSVTGTVLAARSRGQKRAAADWHHLIGAGSVEEVTPARWRMYTDTDRDRLRIPFGREAKTGNVMYLDIKEHAESGSGPHGIVVGTAGSGKSEFLRTLLLSLVATTHPDQVNLLLTDFQDRSTFDGMDRLPHTAAVITNMTEEPGLVTRLREALAGELDRRLAILRHAATNVGAAEPLSDVAEYEKYRERGAELPALPTLLVVVDGFAELLQKHPDFIALLDRICRRGRSLRVHMLLATESLQNDGASIDSIEPDLTYRIALRTSSSQDSRAVIGTPEAQYITTKESGVGFIKMGADDPVKFSTVYTGAPYAAPVAARADDEGAPTGRHQASRAAPVRVFTAAPVRDPAVRS